MESKLWKSEAKEKAISDRGWNPLNFNLMLLPEIRATMTQKERRAEMEESSTIIIPHKFVSHEDTASLSTGNNNNNSTMAATTSSLTTGTDTDTQQSSLNFEFGKAAECIK